MRRTFPPCKCPRKLQLAEEAHIVNSESMVLTLAQTKASYNIEATDEAEVEVDVDHTVQVA